MKIDNVFDIIFSMENLYGALEDASKKRRYNKDVLAFTENTYDNLEQIRQEVYNGTYTIEKLSLIHI